MTIDLIIPDKPEPIITGMGYAYAIENAAGEIMAATTVVAKQDKRGGLNVATIDHAKIAREMADSIVRFAECMDGVAVRVRYMPPDEYAAWCDDNEDDLDLEERDDGDDLDDDADADESDA